ncbi:hypothetical protein ACIBK9_50170 [Nonomuraea sp. NPDC050227]
MNAFDRDVIAKSRQDSHRLGVAVQIIRQNPPHRHG